MGNKIFNTPFRVEGYDKDADVYETLCTAETLDRARELASAVIRKHRETELRRTATGEPFDWFVVTDGMGAVRGMFTADHPDGF